MYLWLNDGHPTVPQKAGTPPPGTPLRSNDTNARLASKGQANTERKDRA